MSARVAMVEDRDWWMPHAMLGAFAVLVAAILRLLFGWSAPLQAWAALAGFAMAVLAMHAGWRTAHCAARRRWRAAAFAFALSAALALTAATMLLAGHAHLGVGGVVLDDNRLSNNACPNEDGV